MKVYEDFKKAQAFINDCRYTHPFAVAILFSGDRAIGCKHKFVVENNSGEVIGVATLAPEGEQCSGDPTLVGIMIHGAHRRQGYGTALLVHVIEFAIKNKLIPLRIDLSNPSMIDLVSKLPARCHENTDFRDLTIPIESMLTPHPLDIYQKEQKKI